MSGFVFSEETLINGNLFKFEQRLKSHVSKYVEGSGELLTTYFSQDENSSTVDRGIQDVDQLFGNKAPSKYIQINNLPLTQFTPTTPENTEEQQLNDIGVEGDAVILPGTIVPKEFDFFIVNHLKMYALFEVTSVQYDTMKVEGYYKIHYRLHTTSHETIDKFKSTQVIAINYTDLNAIGSKRNPIISEDNFVLRSKIEKMVNGIITSYRALFYNERHNCFMYFDPQERLYYFDTCANEFMAKYSLMNFQNSGSVIVLHNKLRDQRFAYRYNNSVYNWVEGGCPSRLLQKFLYSCEFASNYIESSFYLYGEGDEVQIIVPKEAKNPGKYEKFYSIFDDDQLSSFLDTSNEPNSSYFDILLWRFINKQGSLSLEDVPLYLGDISNLMHRDVYFYVPIVVYIIRLILDLN